MKDWSFHPIIEWISVEEEIFFRFWREHFSLFNWTFNLGWVCYLFLEDIIPLILLICAHWREHVFIGLILGGIISSRFFEFIRPCLNSFGARSLFNWLPLLFWCCEESGSSHIFSSLIMRLIYMYLVNQTRNYLR